MARELASTILFSDANLVDYYKLEDATDSKGSNNLTNVNSTTFTSGLFNNAATFNGTNQGLEIHPANPFFTGDAGDKAFSFWFKVSTQPSNSSMRPHVWGNATHGIYITYIDTSGTKTLEINNGNNSVTINFVAITGTWNNVVLTYNGTTKVWDWFVNGIKQPQFSNVSPSINISCYSLGFAQVGTSDFLNGQVDDASVFSRQLTQADVNIINAISIGLMASEI